MAADFAKSGGVTKTTTRTARERDREDVVAKRASFLEKQPSLDGRRLVFLDESGFCLGSSPRYAWAPIGHIAPGPIIGGHWQTISMIGAIAIDGIRNMITINSGTTTDVVEAYVTQQLAPTLGPGDIVVMDNLNVDKNETCVDTIRDAGADVLYLPPYSPEFNPTEKAWAKMKDILRKLDTMTREAFDMAVVMAMDAISVDDCKAWVTHAGYTVNQYARRSSSRLTGLGGRLVPAAANSIRVPEIT